MPPRKGGVARIDGVAWILLVSGLLVALCVFSQEPDAPAVRTANLLGRPGSWLAYELFQTLGLGVYVLLATWFVLVLLLLLRKTWRRWGRRLLGWLLLRPCAAIAADWLGHHHLPGPLIGPGGAVGALLHLHMEAELGTL